MTVRELTKEQLSELKQKHLFEVFTDAGDWPSWYDLATADDLYSDKEIFELYADYNFNADDFDSK